MILRSRRREFRDGNAFTLVRTKWSGEFTYAWGRNILGTDTIYGESEMDWSLSSARKLAKAYLPKWKEYVDLLDELDEKVQEWYAVFTTESELIDDK